MKTSALRFLCCPECRKPLRLEPRLVIGAEVDAGWLVCSSCPAAHPIVRGVPRFVASHRYGAHSDLLWKAFRAGQQRVGAPAHHVEDALASCTGWRRADYRGRLVLDVGVGVGRFAEVAATCGAEVVGVDFNAAVDGAHSRLHGLPNVHVVQADLSSLPFREEVFDLAYSMHVLHHTPHPDLAVASVARTLKASGGFAVRLARRGAFSRHAGPMVRQVTTRLPLSAAVALSAVWSTMCHPVWLDVLPTGRDGSSTVWMERHWRDRWLAAFEWSTATYHWDLTEDDLTAWLRANGCPDVERLVASASVRGRKEPVCETIGQLAPAPRLVAHG